MGTILDLKDKINRYFKFNPGEIRSIAITILVFALFTILTYNGVVFRDYDYFVFIIVLLLIIIAQNTEKKK